MLLRIGTSEAIAITQPAHARLSGQLADAWGNSEFAAPSPSERFAAAVHDIGWLEWEVRPEFDQATKRPRVFADVPVAVHTRLWERGVQHACCINLLTGVLVSLHADTIYQRTFNFAKATPEHAQIVREFLERQRALRDRLVSRLDQDPAQRASVRPERLDFAKRLIAAVDFMSLLMCWGKIDGERIPSAPNSPERSSTLTLAADGEVEAIVDPWPFREADLRVQVEGRRIPLESADEGAMGKALDEAPYTTVECRLRPRKF